MKAGWYRFKAWIALLIQPDSKDPFHVGREYNLNITLLGLLAPGLVFGIAALLLFILAWDHPCRLGSALAWCLSLLSPFALAGWACFELRVLYLWLHFLMACFLGLSAPEVSQLGLTGLVVLVTMAGFIFGIRGALAFALLSIATYLLAPDFGPPSIADYSFTPAAQFTYNVLGLGLGLLAIITHDWITIHRAAQGAELEQRADRFEQERDFAENLIETAHALIVVLDLDGRVLRLNPFTEHLTGYKADEVVGRDWFQLFLPRADRTHSCRL